MPALKLVNNNYQPEADPIDGYEPLFLSDVVLLDRYWSQAAVHLQRAVDRFGADELTVDDMYTGIKAGTMYGLVFRNDEGELPDVGLVLVLQLLVYPQMTVMNVTGMGGKHLGLFIDRYWKHICSWAYMSGVRQLQASVSPAMARIIKKAGFEYAYTTMRMTLTEM